MTKARIVRIRDDVWNLRSAALFVAGGCIAAAGLAPWIGPAVSAVGATCMGLALGVAARGAGVDIDPTVRRIAVRDLFTTTRVAFDEISCIAIRRTKNALGALAWNAVRPERYDVLLKRRAAEELLVRQDVTLASARQTAGQLHQLVGAAVSEEAAPDKASRNTC